LGFSWGALRERQIAFWVPDIRRGREVFRLENEHRKVKGKAPGRLGKEVGVSARVGGYFEKGEMDAGVYELPPNCSVLPLSKISQERASEEEKKCGGLTVIQSGSIMD